MCQMRVSSSIFVQLNQVSCLLKYSTIGKIVQLFCTHEQTLYYDCISLKDKLSDLDMFYRNYYTGWSHYEEMRV